MKSTPGRFKDAQNDPTDNTDHFKMRFSSFLSVLEEEFVKVICLRKG
ncbi:MAG: hypothetical protein MI975_29315 [Cytophagales bacterium]|nr:hypothetical protein [Cytophagales bacterium]